MSPKTALQTLREGLHARMMSAFARRDFAFFEEAVSPDVTFHLSGASPLAGTRHGVEAFLHLLAQAARVVDAGRTPVTYLHDRDRMTARRQVILVGPGERVDAAIYSTLTFDPGGKVTRIAVLPEEQEAFDRVTRSGLEGGAPGTNG